MATPGKKTCLLSENDGSQKMNQQKIWQIVPPPDVPKYAWPAWTGCLHWALGKPDVLAAFKAETGMGSKAPQLPIETRIDEATGYSRSFLDAFIPWFNANVWGAWSATDLENGDHA